MTTELESLTSRALELHRPRAASGLHLSTFYPKPQNMCQPRSSRARPGLNWPDRSGACRDFASCHAVCRALKSSRHTSAWMCNETHHLLNGIPPSCGCTSDVTEVSTSIRRASFSAQRLRPTCCPSLVRGRPRAQCTGRSLNVYASMALATNMRRSDDISRSPGSLQGNSLS